MPELKSVPPYAFGFNACWLAIKNTDPTKISTTLTKQKITGNIFNEPINGFTLVEDVNIDELLDDPADETISDESMLKLTNIRLLETLSEQLGVVCFFVSTHISDAYYGVKAENGNILRVFYAVEGNLYINYGKTPEEETLNLNFSADNPPDEDDVITIAAAWSTDPTQLEEKYGLKPDNLKQPNIFEDTPKQKRIKALITVTLGIAFFCALAIPAFSEYRIAITFALFIVGIILFTLFWGY